MSLLFSVLLARWNWLLSGGGGGGGGVLPHPLTPPLATGLSLNMPNHLLCHKFCKQIHSYCIAFPHTADWLICQNGL